MSSDEEDYMSDAILAGVSDVRPGVSVSYNERRRMKIENERFEIETRQRSAPNKKEIERQALEEGLAKPIEQDNKGFALMAKMGFKAGMTLGRKKEGEEPRGLAEPIPIEIRDGRIGLGRDTQDKEEQKRRCEAHLDAIRNRNKEQMRQLGTYRKRRLDGARLKRVISDVQQCRKTCLELDSRIEKPLPDEWWFWPIRGEAVDPDALKRPRVAGGRNDEPEMRWKYANGREAPPEERMDEMNDEAVDARLRQITVYLRVEHLYCLWCGCQYETFEELERHCPGPCREEHDDADEGGGGGD